MEKKNQTILIVDDSQLNRELLAVMLEDRYSIIEAQNGQEAIEIIEKRSDEIHLILLDLNMPKVDGFGVLRFLNEKNLIEKCPVIMISAENAEDFMDTAYDLGADDYITRPYDMNTILHRVENIIASHQKQLRVNAELMKSNQRYLDLVSSLNKDDILYFHLNITQDTVFFASYDMADFKEFDQCKTIKDVNVFLNQDTHRSTELSMMNQTYLMNAWIRNQKNLGFQLDYELKDHTIIKMSIVVGLLENPDTKDIEAIVNCSDVTETYRKRKLEKLLYEGAYENIGIIDCATGFYKNYSIKSDYHSTVEMNSFVNNDYSYCCLMMAQYFIKPEDKKMYLDNSDLKNVLSQLQLYNKYFFIVRTNSNPVRLSKVLYQYLDETKQSIVMSIRDFTSEQELDALTCSLSHTGFVNCVNEYLGVVPSQEVAVLFVNLKAFKVINDSYSKEGGNELLRQYIMYLVDSLRPIFAGRLEADHFVAFVKRDHLDEQSLQKALNFTFEYSTHPAKVSASCGIYYINDRSVDAEEMISYARLAQSKIQNIYGIQYCIFEEKMQEDYIMKNKLLSIMNESIQNGEFHVYYQPIVDAKTLRIVAAEALVRWFHPGYGKVLPGPLMDELEKNGHISFVDEFVANRVNRMLQDRAANNKYMVPVSINLSRTDFYNKQFMDQILELVETTPLSKDFYRFELTESSYATFEEKQGNWLNRLSDMGCKVLLDDFGSGFSSFSTLKEDYFDILKIDMGFIRKIETNEKIRDIISSIIDMAHKMHLQTVAEGAETQEEVKFLIDNNCDFIQGYYFSKPVDENEFLKMLDEMEGDQL